MPRPKKYDAVAPQRASLAVIREGKRKDLKSKLKAFEDFCARSHPRVRAPFNHDDFLSFGVWLIDNGYASALLYANGAFLQQKLKGNVCRSADAQVMALVYWEINDLNEHLPKKASIQYPISKNPVPPVFRANWFCAMATGCRPVGLENIASAFEVKDKKGVVRCIRLEISNDKGGVAHVARIFCACPAEVACCPIHAFPRPDFKRWNISKDLEDCCSILEKISAPRHGDKPFSSYCGRRTCLCHIEEKIGDLKDLTLAQKLRLNGQFGWVPGSNMFAEYVGKPNLKGKPTRSRFFDRLAEYILHGTER
jgi:hypothetical protein